MPVYYFRKFLVGLEPLPLQASAPILSAYDPRFRRKGRLSFLNTDLGQARNSGAARAIMWLPVGDDNIV